MDPEIVAAARALLPPSTVYVDWAAAALPLPESQPPAFIPPAHHSHHPQIAAARRALSTFLHDRHGHYHVIFTSGATAALNILASRLPWSKNAALHVHAHVHNAVLGMRNPAVAAGATFRSFRSDQLEALLALPRHLRREAAAEDNKKEEPPFALLAYPAECNLTGTKYPVRWAKLAKCNGLLRHGSKQVITVLDTAKLAASAPIELSELHADVDAIVFSMYKLSGFCTGLGALLVRRDSLLENLLRATVSKSYFAGGRSVDAVTPFSLTFFVPPRSLTDMLELGTPNLQSISQLASQLAKFSPPTRVMREVHKHSTGIARLFRQLLLEAFSVSRVKIYEDDTVEGGAGASSIVSFTLFQSQGTDGRTRPIGHTELATVLSVHGIYARSGCMCNIGACASVLNLSDADVANNFKKGHRCGNEKDILGGKPTGLIRVSFGWGSLEADAHATVDALRAFVSLNTPRPITLHPEAYSGQRCPRVRIHSLYVYPVKSCSGYRVKRLKSNDGGGAIGDRVFAVLDVLTEEILSTKTCPELANILTSYSEDMSYLIFEVRQAETLGDQQSKRFVTARSGLQLQMPLGTGFWKKLGISHPKCEEIGSQDTSRHSFRAPLEVNLWLNHVTGRRTALVLMGKEKKEMTKDVLAAYEHEFSRLAQESGIRDFGVLRAAIRPNIVLDIINWEVLQESCDEAEYNWNVESFQNRDARIMLMHGRRRCTVVNIIAQELGVKTSGEPLRSIARLGRQHNRGLVFGFISTLENGSDLAEEMVLTGSSVECLEALSIQSRLVTFQPQIVNTRNSGQVCET